MSGQVIARRGLGLAVVFVLAVTVGPTERAAAARVPCEGRCDDGFGNVMTVQNQCDDAAERCVAGCDTSGARPEPYAECEATGRAAVARPAQENPGGVRVRDGD